MSERMESIIYGIYVYMHIRRRRGKGRGGGVEGGMYKVGYAYEVYNGAILCIIMQL